MHLVYFDGDGIKKNDPVTVVCGISVGDDGQWRSAYSNINWVVSQHVPAAVRDENGYFVPCATEVWSAKYKDHWSMESRAAFLHDLLYIVENTSLGLAWTYVRRELQIANVPDNVRPEQARHAMAFELCVGRVDWAIRTFRPAVERTLCICEDNDQRDLLQEAAVRLSRYPRVIPASPGMEQIAWGRVTKAGPLVYQNQRMIDTVHFVQKGQAPLIALADVCAWALKRYITGKPDAEAFMRSLFSKRPLADAFGTNFNAPHNSGWLVPMYCLDPANPPANPPASLGFPSLRAKD
jgi:hypothetical protein